MRFSFFKNTVLLVVLIGFSCGKFSKHNTQSTKHDAKTEIAQQETSQNEMAVGANQTKQYLPLLKGKRVGVVANQTSVIFKSNVSSSAVENYTHLVDSLLSLNVDIKKVFAPEHGFRGQADAGEHIKDGTDQKTGLPIVSLYGSNKKPSAEQLKNIDVMVFDIQDVGARFYTYISSLHYVMEACAENGIPLLVLDRPNPNGHYIDGPILEPEHQSFVGMHPVPVVHGMTIGEYAQMINGEQWLNPSTSSGQETQCELTVIPVKNYKHDMAYSLPINPSPNLPNDVAINLYPSLCFFEGTNVNAGRGTDKQFQVFGSPFLNAEAFNFEYTPKSNEGAKHPKHEDKLCHGRDLSQAERLGRLDLNHLIDAYQATDDKAAFFNAFFVKLAGTTQLKEQIETRHTAYEIKKTWVHGLEDYDRMRQPYLIYE